VPYHTLQCGPPLSLVPRAMILSGIPSPLMSKRSSITVGFTVSLPPIRRYCVGAVIRTMGPNVPLPWLYRTFHCPLLATPSRLSTPFHTRPGGPSRLRSPIPWTAPPPAGFVVLSSPPRTVPAPCAATPPP